MLKKKNKNKKIDIYTALMLPLMTMFLLNIGLVATTWAWYTASISSGVNTIKAGAQVTVTVKNGEQDVPETDGKYELLGNTTYMVELNAGNAEIGYVVLMDIEDERTSASSSILDLLFTPAYAETINTKYYVELQKDTTKTVTITTPSDSTQKQILSLKKVWCERDGESISSTLIDGYEPASANIDLNPPPNQRSYTIKLLKEDGTPLKLSEVTNGISTFSGNTEEDLDAVITVEDTEETEITMPSFDGYELISVNGDDPKESYLLIEGKENEFNAVYKKIETKEESITGSGKEEIIAGNNETGGSESAVVEIPAQTESSIESTTPISGSGSTETQISFDPILETTGEQETVNTEPEQPATLPQEQQQDESSEEETVINDVPVAQSEETAIEENMEVVDNAQSESGD